MVFAMESEAHSGKKTNQIFKKSNIFIIKKKILRRW